MYRITRLAARQARLIAVLMLICISSAFADAQVQTKKQPHKDDIVTNEGIFKGTSSGTVLKNRSGSHKFTVDVAEEQGNPGHLQITIDIEPIVPPKKKVSAKNFGDSPEAFSSIWQSSPSRRPRVMSATQGARHRAEDAKPNVSHGPIRLKGDITKSDDWVHNLDNEADRMQRYDSGQFFHIKDQEPIIMYDWARESMDDGSNQIVGTSDIPPGELDMQARYILKQCKSGDYHNAIRLFELCIDLSVPAKPLVKPASIGVTTKRIHWYFRQWLLAKAVKIRNACEDGDCREASELNIMCSAIVKPDQIDVTQADLDRWVTVWRKMQR